jgi:hypothetical protein
VFFSFHYERDIWRANVVRNSWRTHQDRQAAGFWDASLWERAKLRGERAIRQMIDAALYKTSVTAVLIGAETYMRGYVQYEISQSYSLMKGLLGIRIHNIADRRRELDWEGENSMGMLSDTRTGVLLSDIFPPYDWFSDDGYHNIGDWVEEAAQAAGRY